MFSVKKIGFIGSGNMAEALIRGILDTGLHIKEDIYCSDISAERLSYMKDAWGVSTAAENTEVVKNADTIFLSVKPTQVKAVLEEIVKGVTPQKLIISIAAGISTDFIESKLKNIPVIRVMPNTPALVLSGMTAISGGRYAMEEHIGAAETIFRGVGETVRIDEELIDAVTALSGSGPAYIFIIIEALADAGVRVGLPRRTALLLASQTVLGAAKMVKEGEKHPAELKDMVASPGGTTIEGLAVLEEDGVRGALIEAVEAAYRRAKALKEK
jgi:pyrroline-5-carboxylate reductase